MSTDPFNIVKDELKRTVTKTRQLVDELQKRKHDDKLRHEIRTNLTSITWDIQDLEETISIAAQNPAKFNLSQADIESRRQFIAQTTEFVEKTKRANNIDLDVKSAEQTSKADSASVTFNDVKPSVATSGGTSKYTRLVDGDDPDAGSKSANQFGSRQNQDNSNNGSHTLQMQHSEIFKEQEKNLDLISSRVTSLKNISQSMHNELDDQAELLDDLDREIDTADTRMQMVMKRIAKVMHMTNDKRQWTMIVVLLIAILVVIILLAALP